MIELSPEYIKDLQNIIEEKDTDKIKALLKDLHPADIAEIYKELSLEEAEFTYNLLEPEIAAEVLMELEEDDRQKLLKHVSNEEIAHQVIEQLDTDDAVDLIREMDEEDQEEILAHIDDVEQAGDIVDLLKYDEDTAGGLMGTEMVIVNENWSMPECLKEMRQQAEEMDEIYYVYVVDDDHKLKGVFPLKKIITHQSVAKIKHVMKREPISLHTDTPIDEVAQAFEKYNLVAMPVVDSIGRLVGRITVDDIMDEVREQSEREYQLASGISQDVEVDDSVFTQTRARLPWLVIGIFGGLLNSIMLGGFEAGLAAVPAIALFIPLIAGTAGNVGVQSSAIIVQGLANGSLDLRNVGTQILKEVGVSLINASIIALLTFAFNMLIGTEADITVAVSISLFAVVIFASIFGTLVPITLEKFKIDPAIATGPFITTTNDIVGLLIYMLCCTLMLA
ncbi:MAG: magnesium transporter [Bacteroidales bacterium]|nr:magnesium transporter [Bacteroidales bacterium]